MDMIQLIRQIVLAAQLPESLSEHLSLEIEKQIRMSYAGDRFYVAKYGSQSDKEARNRLICAQFDGRNHATLATKYRLTVRQVRRIVDHLPQVLPSSHPK